MVFVGQEFRSIWTGWFCLKVSHEVTIKSVAKVGVISKASVLTDVNTSKAQGWSLGSLRQLLWICVISPHDVFLPACWLQTSWTFSIVVQASKGAYPQKQPDESCITDSNWAWEVMPCNCQCILFSSESGIEKLTDHKPETIPDQKWKSCPYIMELKPAYRSKSLKLGEMTGK